MKRNILIVFLVICLLASLAACAEENWLDRYRAGEAAGQADIRNSEAAARNQEDVQLLINGYAEEKKTEFEIPVAAGYDAAQDMDAFVNSMFRHGAAGFDWYIDVNSGKIVFTNIEYCGVVYASVRDAVVGAGSEAPLSFVIAFDDEEQYGEVLEDDSKVLKTCLSNAGYSDITLGYWPEYCQLNVEAQIMPGIAGAAVSELANAYAGIASIADITEYVCSLYKHETNAPEDYAKLFCEVASKMGFEVGYAYVTVDGEERLINRIKNRMKDEEEWVLCDSYACDMKDYSRNNGASEISDYITFAYLGFGSSSFEQYSVDNDMFYVTISEKASEMGYSDATGSTAKDVFDELVRQKADHDKNGDNKSRKELVCHIAVNGYVALKDIDTRCKEKWGGNEQYILYTTYLQDFDVTVVDAVINW